MWHVVRFARTLRACGQLTWSEIQQYVCLLQHEVETLQHTEAIQAELGGLGIGGEPVSLLSSIDGVHLDDLPLHDAATATAPAGRPEALSLRNCAHLQPSPDLRLDCRQD